MPTATLSAGTCYEFQYSRRGSALAFSVGNIKGFIIRTVLVAATLKINMRFALIKVYTVVHPFHSGLPTAARSGTSCESPMCTL